MKMFVMVVVVRKVKIYIEIKLVLALLSELYSKLNVISVSDSFLRVVVGMIGS